MSYNFKEALKGLNNTQYIEEDAEKVLKLVVEKAKETRMTDISALLFALALENNKYYISATLYTRKKQATSIEPVEQLDKDYAYEVMHRIRDILTEQKFEWKTYTLEMNEMLSKREKKFIKYFKCYAVYL